MHVCMYVLFLSHIAKTGVFPDEATVHFNEGDATVQLSYFIYSPQSNLPMTVHHNGVLVTDDISTFPDVTSCVQSTISEQAIIFIVTIVNPTFDSAGVYELVVGDSLSAVATLGVCVCVCVCVATCMCWCIVRQPCWGQVHVHVIFKVLLHNYKYKYQRIKYLT